MATKKSSGAGAGAGAAVAGVALAAVAAAAAGAYFFGTKEGAKNRKVIGAWAKKAKTEVMKEIKVGKITTKKAYHDAVAQVMAKYKNVKNVDPKEVVATIAEMKKHWVSIEKDMKKHAAEIKKTAAKTVKSGTKVAKKVVKAVK